MYSLLNTTHVCNAFRGQEVLDWFDSLAPLGRNIAAWADIQTAFQVDFKAALTTTSVIYKNSDPGLKISTQGIQKVSCHNNMCIVSKPKKI